MTRQSDHVQLTLVPPEVVEATLRIGVIGSRDHLQVQVDVRDPGTGELLARWARPHAPYGRLDHVLEECIHELQSMIVEIVGPF